MDKQLMSKPGSKYVISAPALLVNHAIITAYMGKNSGCSYCIVRPEHPKVLKSAACDFVSSKSTNLQKKMNTIFLLKSTWILEGVLKKGKQEAKGAVYHDPITDFPCSALFQQDICLLPDTRKASPRRGNQHLHLLRCLPPHRHTPPA